MFFLVDPTSGIVVSGPARWVVATGHRMDPAAETCHWVYPPDTPPAERYDDADAVALCQEHFVLESIETTTAP